jgi:arginase family enzyme
MEVIFTPMRELLPPAPDPGSLSPDERLDELGWLLRPPGQGIHTVSSGKRELLAKTRAYLGEFDEHRPWREHIAALLAARPKVAMLAIPSDTGAGIVRGAARGPEAIRAALGRAPAPDLGDVFCIPHLLDEPMVSQHQRMRCQDALWPQLEVGRRRTLPVSPVGMAERARRLLLSLAPELSLFTIGGDHTVTWPVIAPLLELDRVHEVGIVHFDAHTDLLPERLGVRICFATWAFHANAALGGGERMIQIGIRASGRDRGHWERELEVRQIWADEALALGPDQLAAQVVEHLRSRGLRRIYVSNDIDGTDDHWAAACGTPEPGGLSPAMVVAVIQAVSRDFELIGGDLVELAPGLSLDRAASERSIETAALYTRETLAALAIGNRQE